MAPRSKVETAGLDLVVEQQADGKYQATLTDDSGTQVWSKGGYKDENNAKVGARYWVEQRYDLEAVEVEPRKKPGHPPKQQPAPDIGNNAQLVRVMRKKAQANEDQAVRLRQSADQLEAEAKRLTAAADVLEGPEA